MRRTSVCESVPRRLTACRTKKSHRADVTGHSDRVLVASDRLGAFGASTCSPCAREPAEGRRRPAAPPGSHASAMLAACRWHRRISTLRTCLPTSPTACRWRTSARRSCGRPRRATGRPCRRSTSTSSRRCSTSSGPERPTDAFVGEEVGPHAGTSGRRWIVDGIDGTHNYADGRAGWGTIIACEVDGEIVIGVVSSPRFGRRWWAVAGQRRVVGAVPAGRQVRRGHGQPAAVRIGGRARPGVGDRHPVRGRDASVGATRSRGGSPRQPRRGASASRSMR